MKCQERITARASSNCQERTAAREGNKCQERTTADVLIKRPDGSVCADPKEILVRKNSRTENLFVRLEEEREKILSENAEQDPDLSIL